MAPDYDDLFEDAPDLLPLKQYLLQELDSCNVEDLKLSLKKCLTDARKKIAKLRKEVKDKQESLEKERIMRETAENELRNLSKDINREYTHSFYSSANRSIANNPLRRQNGSSDEDTLMEELRSSRQLNKALTEKLSLTEVELEKMYQTKTDMKMEMEAVVAARGAVLIDKIYTAQKSRDVAVTARLKLLTQENEELVKRINQLEVGLKGCDSGVEMNSMHDDNFHPDHLHFIGSLNGTHDINYHGEKILDRMKDGVNFSKQKSSDNNESFPKVAEENVSLRKERDDAQKKIAQLEDEIRIIREEHEILETQSKSERNRFTITQVQLKNKQQELDDVLSEKNALQAEIQNLKLRYSLKNSLSLDQGLREQFNTTLDEFESKFIDKESQLNYTKSSYEELLLKYNSIVREKKAIAEQLQDTLKQATDDKKRADKLERLVEVLRKRKNNAVSGIIE